MLGCSIHREIDATVAFLHITSTSRLSLLLDVYIVFLTVFSRKTSRNAY